MTGRYRAYSEYKNSGVEWLGEVPLEWNVYSGKRIFTSIRKTGLEADEQLAASQAYGVIPQSLMMKLNGAKVMLALKGTSSFRHVDKNDFVISLRSFEGGIEHSNYDGCVSPAYTVLKPIIEVDYIYFKYLLKCKPFIAALQASTDSLRDGKSISFEQFGSIYLPLASYFEQQKITYFLDNETAKIDILIAKQEKLIELLKEKRQAVISHAVTRDLNPNVPIKDSGVEWLGEVPEHWATPKIGYHCNVTKLTGFEFTNHWKTSDLGQIVALRGFNIGERRLSLEKTEKITEHLSKYLARTKLILGDIVLPCTGTLGNAAVIPESDKFHINQNIAKLRFDSKVDPTFAVYWLTCDVFRTIIDFNNTSGMQPVLLIGDIRNIVIPIPSKGEQRDIVSYLDKKVNHYNLLISKCENSKKLIQERKTALISAAVTGKIDVRNWQK
jgi:type I restriction enzyme S subunit